MRCAAHGDTVRVHFTGRFTEGSVVTTTEGMAPIQIEIGEGKALKGLEEGLVGMCAGDRKTIEVPPRKGFGEHKENLVAEIRKELLPKDMVASLVAVWKVREPRQIEVEEEKSANVLGNLMVMFQNPDRSGIFVLLSILLPHAPWLQSLQWQHVIDSRHAEVPYSLPGNSHNYRHQQ